MASQAHNEPITGSSLTASPLQASPFSTQKKKKIQSQKLNPINPSCRWRLASRRVVAGWQRDQSPIQKQTKHRTQQAKHRAQRCLSKKKKKILNTQTKIKPSKPLTHGRSRRRRRRRSKLVVVVVVVVVRLVAPHRRSEIGERRTQIDVRCSPLGAPSGPPSMYFALFSL